MTDSLAVYTQYDQMEKAATALQKSGYFKDVTSQAQAIVKVMAGAELGLPPFASMSGIHIIQGKPVLGANILATLVKNDRRYNYQIDICNDKVCELIWSEDGKRVGNSSFTFEEAKAAGLTDKDNWRKYPSDMLFARAISRGARRFAPGIFGGSPVYTPDEMGVETDEEGMIDAVATDPNPNGHEPPTETPMSIEVENAINRLDSKGKKYGASTNEQLGYKRTAIEAKLKGELEGTEQDALLAKLEDISLILDWRKNHST